MKIEKSGILLKCGNYSIMFDGEERKKFVSADQLISAELGALYCPRTGVVRAMNCEMLVVIEKWNEQILLSYLNFGSADEPEVDFYGIESKFIKLYLESDSNDRWYIKQYEIYDGNGNILEEKEF
jgi:hypothetical protein